MRGARRQRREAAEAQAGAVALALADVTCRCGQVLEGQAAYAIHADSGCEHPEAFGQLVQLKDGRWGQRWRHPEIT